MATGRRDLRSPVPPAAVFDLRQYLHPKGYVRVSTDDQAEEGTSIPAQIQQLKAFAAAHGVHLRDEDLYVDEGWSGKNLDRPAVQRLRADATAGMVDCILVCKLDRLSRDLRDTVNLCLGEWQDDAPPNRQVVLKSISEPFDTCTDFGRMVFGLLAMFAEFERRRIADRTLQGKRSRALDGRNPGHRAPYGFRLVPAPDGKASYFEVDPEEATVVKRIAAMYLQGFGDPHIAHRLNEEGLRYRGGSYWQGQLVGRILRHPMIAGVYAYGRLKTDGNGSRHTQPEERWVYSDKPITNEPIVSPEVFAALKQLRQSRRTGGRGEGSTYLLSGLVRCAHCDRACTVRTSGTRHKPYNYYRCLIRKEAGTTACNQPPIRVDLLDDQVLAAVRAVVLESRDALVARMHASADRHRVGRQQRLQELEAEERRLDELREHYFQWLEQGHLRPDAVQVRLDELSAKRAAANDEKRLLETDLSALESKQVSMDAYEQIFNSFSEAWSALTLRERKRLIATLIKKVEVDGRSVIIHWAHDFVEVEIVST